MEFRATALRDERVAERYRQLHEVTLHELASVLADLYERTTLTPPVPPPTLAAILVAMGAGAVLESRAGDGIDEGAARQAMRAVLGLPSPGARQ